MSVGQGGHYEVFKSSEETFFNKIEAEGGQFGSLYKTYWLSWRVNFLDETDYRSLTGSVCEFDRVPVIEIGVSTEF